MSRQVELRVYDLSGGLASALSQQLLGKKVDGVWHTGVVVGGVEYFFGQGIQQVEASKSPFGTPHQTIPMGETEVPDELIQDFLHDLGSKFNAATYDLMNNNCNSFSNEVCEFLVGQSIPEHITGLPQEVMSAPMGPMLMEMLQPVLQNQLGNATAAGIAAPPTASASAGPSARGPSAAPAPPATTAATAPAGVTKATPKLYQTALEDEFRKVMAGGEGNVNRAVAAAVRRVTDLVLSGAVLPPERKSQAAGCMR